MSDFLSSLFPAVSAVSSALIAGTLILGIVRSPFKKITDKFDKLEKELTNIYAEFANIENNEKVMLALLKQTVPAESAEMAEDIIRFGTVKRGK